MVVYAELVLPELGTFTWPFPRPIDGTAGAISRSGDRDNVTLVNCRIPGATARDW